MGYIRSFLSNTSSASLATAAATICNNYVDLYIGDLSPTEIAKETLHLLEEKHISQFEEYQSWLKPTHGFRTIQLTDGSDWILRLGDDPERYIHIHPARTGTKSLRFKGSTLKTVYALKVSFPTLQVPITINQINIARGAVGLPPVKQIEQGKGIWRCLERCNIMP